MNTLLLHSLVVAAFTLGSHLVAMEDQSKWSLQNTASEKEAIRPLRTDFTQQGIDSITLITADDVIFKVSQQLVELSHTLKDVIADSNTEKGIPLHSITSKQLEGTLLYLETGTIPSIQGIKELLNILAASNYLDIKINKEFLLEELVKKLSWQGDSLEQLLSDCHFHFSDTIFLIKRIAGKLEWNMDGMGNFCKNMKIPDKWKLALLEEMIEQEKVQLAQFVGYAPNESGSWIIHEEHCKVLEIDPMLSCMIICEPTEDEKHEHTLLKDILGDYYTVLKERFLKKYPPFIFTFDE